MEPSATPTRPTFPYRPLSLALLLVPFLVGALMLLYNQASQPLRPTRQLASAAQVGGGILSVMALIGTGCACLRHCMVGCPKSLCCQLLWGYFYLVVNSASVGMCGIIWLGCYFWAKRG